MGAIVFQLDPYHSVLLYLMILTPQFKQTTTLTMYPSNGSRAAEPGGQGGLKPPLSIRKGG